ncbi:hypothetical protein FPY71_17265 [Aureimonas fodinaquatilis]|uniref:Uncharacterized protein n=1 Tax=Aureimonas fodinaquatilis TaxID=2565783 RepID=A0A5B0DQ62_9HYPH|nr:hypothetical protein [Aureimonas fodinaquatilis]KAA0968626.1 hypothetical protein FPY71_17265 [Aureimonas fodinaquatilis]
MSNRVFAILALVAPLAMSGPAIAQIYAPGPIAPPAQSAAGMRIDGAPSINRGVDISSPNLDGDTPEKRAYGRAYDDSYLRQNIPRPRLGTPMELRATQGRSTLNSVNSGYFARSGPAAIGSSNVTRPSLGGRRTPGRAIIVD